MQLECIIYFVSSQGSIATLGNIFGDGSASHFLNSFGCAGSEARILDCPHSTNPCTSRRNAGVRCHTQTSIS